MSNPPERPPDNERDETLLHRYRKGERAAFDALYARVGGRLFAFALQLTHGRRADAEDLVQETFIAAYRGAGGFRGRSRLMTWLFGIMARRNRDNNRRPQPATTPIEDAPDDSSLIVAPTDDTTLSACLLREAVAQLDAPLRDAFLLVVAQGLTHREAAQVLSIPLGTCKWRVFEATKRLRVALTDEPLPTSAPPTERPSQERRGKNDESENLLKIHL